MRTLAFLDPGHFHAALTLRERQTGVTDEIFVYAPAGPELDHFLALIHAFNRRPEHPTAWRPIVRPGDGSLERLLADRPGDCVVLAGRNDRKAGIIRRLHDAGHHVLADKPWLASATGLDDLRRALISGALAVEIMTGRHEITSILTRKLMAERDVFGDFDTTHGDGPAIEMTSVHHLEKTVNGAPVRRPPWFFDVRVQGDGIADIPTHMVDYVQRLVAAVRGPGDMDTALELVSARRWATPVPRDLFTRATGEPNFPPELREVVVGSVLAYYGNAALSLRAGGVPARLETRWDLSEPAGGGDMHRASIRGTRARIEVEQSGATAFRRRLVVSPVRGPEGLRAALGRAIAGWQPTYPGLALSASDTGWEIQVPRGLDTGHESHFPLVLAEFLAMVEAGSAPPALARDTLAKYALLARAAMEAKT